MQYFIYFWGEWIEVKELAYYDWKRLGFVGIIKK